MKRNDKHGFIGRHGKHILLGLCAAGAGFLSCIKNDIPYPTIPADFLKFEVEGSVGSAKINTELREVAVEIADTEDPKKVRILNYEVTENATVTPEIGEYLDLSQPKEFVLSIYQDYRWTIRCTQNILREFKIRETMKGEANIDAENRRVVAYVPTSVPLNAITVESLVLGPSNAVMTPEVRKGDVLDFTSPLRFTVAYRDITEEWTVTILQTEETVTTESANGWVKVAWLKGIGLAGADNGFEIRKASDTQWTKVDPATVTHDGGNFTARVTGLEPQTAYVCRAYSGENFGSEIAFTTEAATPLENGSLDDWCMIGNVWSPWASGSLSFWDTGNGGATVVGGDKNNISSPTDDIWSGKTTGQAAKLESKYIVVKFAAGNLFTGKFTLDGFDGALDFGRPYTSRPTALKGHYKYVSTLIQDYSRSGPDFSHMSNRPDTGIIYIALADWDAPYKVRTKKSARRLFDKNDPGIIAYAEMAVGKSTEGNDYHPFELKLDYRAVNRKPAYILVVCTASKYGDYFTGGRGSTLWVDELELKFD